MAPRRFRPVLLPWMVCLLAALTTACGMGREAPAKAPGEKDSAGLPGAAPPPVAPPPSLFDSDAVALEEAAPGADAPAADAQAPVPGVPGAVPPATAARAPLLIYKAQVTLAVFETSAAMAAVRELARSRGGYLVSESDQTVTVRIPARGFEDALAQVSKLGDELHREVSVDDVTAEVTDLETRLRNALAVRDRLEALLAKAAKVEDALAVERELERVTQTIEQIKGRLKLLRELTAFSTISVHFRSRPKDQVGSDVRLPFDWLSELGLPSLLSL